MECKLSLNIINLNNTLRSYVIDGDIKLNCSGATILVYMFLASMYLHVSEQDNRTTIGDKIK